MLSTLVLLMCQKLLAWPMHIEMTEVTTISEEAKQMPNKTEKSELFFFENLGCNTSNI